MKRLAFAVLLVLGCGAPVDPPLCVTRCGLRYQGRVTTRNQDYTCDEVQRVEDRLITEITPQYPEACQALRNWDLYNSPDPKWIDYWGRNVAGLTNCRTFVSEIGRAPIGETALAHEMVHMVQSCYGGQVPDPGMDDSHGDWIRRGLFELVDRVNAQPVQQVAP